MVTISKIKFYYERRVLEAKISQISCHIYRNKEEGCMLLNKRLPISGIRLAMECYGVLNEWGKQTTGTLSSKEEACVYVYMYVCTYVCHVCMYVCMCVYVMYACMCVYVMYACMCVYVYICHIRMNVCLPRMCVCMYATYVYMYVCMYVTCMRHLDATYVCHIFIKRNY